MQSNETGRCIASDPEHHTHHGTDSHDADFDERHAIRSDELPIDTRSSPFVNTGHERGIICTTRQAFSQAIVKPAGRQYLRGLCLPQDIPVRVIDRAFAIGGYHEIGKLRKRVFGPDPLMRGEERL